jgi:cytochrome c oxidase subunit 1
MTATAAPAAVEEPGGIIGWLTMTDHKKIGVSYVVTAFVFFIIAGVMALIIRAELAAPGLQFVTEQEYNELFTMHGSLMLFVFATAVPFGLANYLVPLQIGAPDMAFPRLNAFSYWLYLGGSLTMLAGFLTAGGAAAFGWTAYAPLSDAIYSPGPGSELWIVGIALTGTATIGAAANLIATVLTMRAPGMTMFRLPIFTWNMTVTSIMVLLAFPVLTAGLMLLLAERLLGAHIFDPTYGGVPILWQHMFWFFGHPEVYIIALPFFGVVTEIIPVFSRKPLFGYTGFVFATLAIAGLSLGVWAHHMFATGLVFLQFFSAATFLIAVPTGVKFFNWIATMWRGHLSFESPMLFSLGFLVVFLFGGLTGVMLASPPIDFNTTDTYFVVGHMHYVLFSAAVFALFAGVYFWFPKATGRLLSERWAKVHFWLMFIGFNLAFLPQHLLGLRGMVRRIADYSAADGWTTLNMVSTIGAFLIAVSVAVFIVNAVWGLRHGPRAGSDPWNAYSLEWATTSPPPMTNFASLPPIHSERPAFDERHPELTS